MNEEILKKANDLIAENTSAINALKTINDIESKLSVNRLAEFVIKTESNGYDDYGRRSLLVDINAVADILATMRLYYENRRDLTRAQFDALSFEPVSPSQTKSNDHEQTNDI